MWNGSAEGHTFAQFEPGREQAVGDEEDSSQRRRSPADVVNGEQFHGDESNTGEFAGPLVNNFEFVHLPYWEWKR
jgi:hypothetical protein